MYVLTMYLSFLPVVGHTHGLSKNFDGQVLVTRDGRYMVKAVVTPKHLEFVREHAIRVSIIDIEQSEHYYGTIKMHLSRDNEDPGEVALSNSVFEKGLFKTFADIKAGGAYTIRLHLDGPDVKKTFSLAFTIEDKRKKPLMIIMITLMYFGCIPAFVYIVQRRKTATIQNINASPEIPASEVEISASHQYKPLSNEHVGESPHA
jgi:hypothetical protein